MMIEVKVSAKFYTNATKKEIKTIENLFKGFDYTKEGAIASINKQIKRYSNNPLVIEVKRVETKMIENPFA